MRSSTWSGWRSGTQLLKETPGLEDHPTFLFFKGAANGLFATGTEELTDGLDEAKAILIGIRCERGSHSFFKKYGERFEESEGKRIFLEFADEEREHLDMLLKQYRKLVAGQRAPSPKSRRRGKPRKPAKPARRARR
jgi:hypothetical protein